MTATTAVVLSLVVFVAALVQGTSGIGFALIVSPAATLLAPELVPTVVLLLMLPLNAFVTVRERRSVDWRGAAWISVARIAFTLVGLLLVTVLSATGLTVLVALVTIGAALVSLMAPPFTPTPASFLVAGALTGVSETATGVGGPPMGLVYQHSRPAVLRSTVAACFFVGEVVSLVALTLTGSAPRGWLGDSLLLLPAVVLGTLASTLVVRRFPHLDLRTVVIVFSVVSGVVLLIQAAV